MPPQDAKEDTQVDDLQDEFLGALGSLGGSLPGPIPPSNSLCHVLYTRS
jgi:hypothetical protein